MIQLSRDGIRKKIKTQRMDITLKDCKSDSFWIAPSSTKHESENTILLTPTFWGQAFLSPESNKFSILSSSGAAIYGNANEKLEAVNRFCWNKKLCQRSVLWRQYQNYALKKGKLALTFKVLTRAGSEFLFEETSEDSNCRRKRTVNIRILNIAHTMQKRNALFLAVLLKT